MKKIFKALSIMVAGAALCGGIAMTTGCVGGNGVYEGDYHYVSHYQTYGIKVKVTVENNIITKVEDVTNGAYHTVSSGFVNYYVASYNAASDDEKQDPYKFPVVPDVGDWGVTNAKEIEAIQATYYDYYSWQNADEEKWNNYEAWLLQQYEGWSVADILAIDVYIDAEGVPYEQEYNASFASSELLIGNATQGSGRLMLAVQNALGK